MQGVKFYLDVVAGRDGLHHPALCLLIEDELWYLFQGKSGTCFRRNKVGIIHDFSPVEIKEKKHGIFRIMTQKWNQINLILKSK